MEKLPQYKMNHGNRGHFIIISNDKFEGGWKNRNGTENDAKRLEATFTKLGFNPVKIWRDLKAKEMLNAIENVAQLSHATNDCFGLAILTHGGQENGKDLLFGVDGESIELEKLMEPLKSPEHSNGQRNTLAGKPKLIFVQACRGEKLQEGVTLERYSTDDDNDADSDECCYSADGEDEVPPPPVVIPIEADFLYHYATPAGCFAWRTERGASVGAVFIQTLCDVLDKHVGEDLDLVSMLTCVNGRVAEEYETNARQAAYSKKKQMPVIQSQLRKLVVLTEAKKK